MNTSFHSSKNYYSALIGGSASKEIAATRNQVYEKVLHNLDDLAAYHKNLRFHTSAAEDFSPSGMGVTLKDASIRAFVQSFAGFVAIERPLSQLSELQVYEDYLLRDNTRVVSPNIGPDAPRDRAEQEVLNTSLSTGASTPIALTGPVLPKSIRGTIIDSSSNVVSFTDDGQGNLLAPAGALVSGSINYSTGSLDIEPTTAGDATIYYTIDKTVANPDNRIKARQGYFTLTASINVYEFEANLITSAITNKTLGVDPITRIKERVKDEQILSINSRLVSAIVNGAPGNTLTIDLSAFSVAAGKFDSLLRVFRSGLVSVDSALATRTYKAVKATAYIVGTQVADLFESLTPADGWEALPSSYINGHIGNYKGIPVLQYAPTVVVGNVTVPGVAVNEGYAIHVTPGGELAPTALGILLPVTDLPLIGNFNSTQEVAGGIYSVDGVVPLATDLVQRFVVELPADWMVLA